MQLPSDPYLFRLIKRSAAGFVAFVFLSAAWLPAPLQEAATVGQVPESVKAAWFLAWVQELVSYSNIFIYLVLAVCLGFFFLPFLPGVSRVEKASWFPADQRVVNAVTMCVFCLILLLTIVAIFFRGAQWQLGFFY